MAEPALIIITGPPCTGKTTLGRKVAAELYLPFINKDSLKELLFDRLGWRDRAWSKLLGYASYDLLYYFVAVQLQAGKPAVVESNFKAEYDTAKFLALKEQHNFQPFQIACYTEGEVLYRRFVERAASGQRHPGHVDQETFEELRAILLKGESPPLGIGGQVLRVDTTDLATIDYDAILETLRPLVS
jgi:predicted kinase